MAVGFSQIDGDLVITGGVAGGSGNARYPTTRIHYNTRTRTAAASPSNGTGGGFTWCGGVELNERLIYLDGHNAVYNNQVWSVPIKNTGNPIALPASQAPTRHSSLVMEHAGIIYRMGGFGSNGQLVNKAHAYNPATGTWVNLPDMPFACNGIIGGAYDGKLYVMSGWCENPRGNIPGIQIFDIASNKWSVAPNDHLTVSWGQGALFGKYFFYVRPSNVDGHLIIQRYDLTNPTGRPKAFKIPHVGNRFAGAVKIDAVAREFHIIGGCVSPPGSANYDNLQRHNNIITVELDTLV